MKTILACLLFASTPAMLSGNDYRFFELIVSNQETADEAKTNPGQFLQQIDDKNIIVKSYAVVKKNSDTPLSLDRTYTIPSPNVVERPTTERSQTEQKVGLEITVKEKDGGKIKAKYRHSAVERWTQFGRSPDNFVPMLHIVNLEGDLGFSSEGFATFDGLYQEDNHWILIIERVPEAGSPGNAIPQTRKNEEL